MAYGVSYGPNALLEDFKRRISKVESGGNYSALGPQVARKSGTDRAYGKYQVMGSNIPQWTQEALGRPLTAMEFLNSPEAQEKVFEHQTLKNLHKYGTLEDAASVWFSGRPLAQAKAAGAHDVNIPVSEYVNRVMGPQAGGPVKGTQVAGSRFDSLYGDVTPAPEAVPAPAQGSRFDSLYEPQNVAPQAPVAPAPSMPKPVPIAAPKDEWGATQGFINGLALGGYPQLKAMYETGNIPYLRQTNPENYQRRVEEIKGARQAYGERHPLYAAAAETAGSIAPMALTMNPLTAGARLAGEAIVSQAPKAASVLNFLAGEAGRRAPGLVGTATRLGSQATRGAAEGAAAGLIGQGLGPEDMTLGEKVGAGAVGGAILGPVAQRLFGAAPGGRFDPNMEDSLRRSAQAWNKEFPSLNIRAGQVAKGAAHEYDVANIAPHMNDTQVQAFQDEVKKVVRSKLTPKAVKDMKEYVGGNIGMVTQGLPAMQPDMPLARELNGIFNEVMKESDPAVRRQVEQGLNAIFNELIQPGGISADKIQNLFTSGGLIDRRLAGTSNEIKQHYGTLVRDMLGDFFARKHPGRQKLWDELRSAYRDLSTLEGIVNESGVVSPQAVSKAVEKRGSRSALDRLGRAGKYLPDTDIRGGAVNEGKELPPLEKLAKYMPTYPLAVGTVGYLMHNYAPNLMSHLPIVSEFNPTAVGTALGGYTVGNILADKALGGLLTTKAMNERLLRGGQKAFGPGMAAGVRGGVEFFDEKPGQRRSKRK